jgi:hypothetical protein
MGDPRAQLDALAKDDAAQRSRLDVCDSIAGWLATVGQLLWVSGFFIGPDRAAGWSPFDFGDDRSVGVATVAQIGGELASGATALLRAGNRYAAAALVRQLVEVEYLAAAFGEEHEVASEWLRADREGRLRFWSPARLRERSQRRFLKTDYWHHCEMGGHPATPGMALLPDHSNAMPAAFLTADLVGHLLGIWRGLGVALKEILSGPPPANWQLADLDSIVAGWLQSDELYAAFQSLGASMSTNNRQG